MSRLKNPPVLFLSPFLFSSLANVLVEDLLPLLGRQEQVPRVEDDLVQLLLPGGERRDLLLREQVSELGHPGLERHELALFGRSDLSLHGGLFAQVNRTLLEKVAGSAVGFGRGLLLLVQLVLETKVRCYDLRQSSRKTVRSLKNLISAEKATKKPAQVRTKNRSENFKVPTWRSFLRFLGDHNGA